MYLILQNIMTKDPNNPIASKIVWIISALTFLSSILSFVALALFRAELISTIRFSQNQNLILEAISSNNKNHILRLPFYTYKSSVAELFKFQDYQEFSLSQFKSQLLQEVNSFSDQEWSRFNVLDDSKNYLKLYYRYCQEFLQNPDYFPNNKLTEESAQLFVKKFELIEKTQFECNILAQTFFISIAMLAVALISAILMVVAAHRIIKHGIIVNYSPNTFLKNVSATTKPSCPAEMQL